MGAITQLLLGGFLLFGNLIESAAPANILLVFPHHITSHYRAFIPVVEELAARGHQITEYVHPIFKRQQPISNLRQIVVTPGDPVLAYFDFISWRKRSAISYIHAVWNLLIPLTESTLKSPELQALIRSEEKFDLVMVEATFGQECFVAFGHKFSAPVVNLHPHFVSSLVAQQLGLPHSFSYISDSRLPFTDQMTLLQRAHNAWFGLYEMIVGNLYYLPHCQETLMRQYFKYPGSETLPPLKTLIANVSLHLIDSHPIFSYIRPYSPNVIDVAGMNIKPEGKLPQDIQKFMDEAKEGVIYFSFGTILRVHHLSPHLRQVFVETMKNLKQRIIWKWDEKIDGAQHILIRSWLPQQEILAHPNCKLFITHGGFNSLVEAMSIGIPVLGLPVFSDQFHNVEFYKLKGVGLEANLDWLTVEDLTHKIKQIIHTPSFTENAKRLSTMFHDEPQTSLEKATYWVEYVMRNQGAHHLKPASVGMPYYKYMLLDVIAFCIISLLLIVYVLFYLAGKIVRICCSSKRKTPKLVQNKSKKYY